MRITASEASKLASIDHVEEAPTLDERIREAAVSKQLAIETYLTDIQVDSLQHRGFKIEPLKDFLEENPNTTLFIVSWNKPDSQ